MNMLKSLVAVATIMGAGAAMADDDMLRLQSPRGFDDTVTHLRQGLEGKGMTAAYGYAEAQVAGWL